MNNSPLVSVIIPVYNAERFVESAVRSIMNQTYTNLEILVTDDCSTDGSFEILQRLASEDSRITLYRNEANLKIVGTLNSLVAAASGKYIARMDADDISLPTRIEKQVAFLESNPDYALCGTNAWHIDENGRRIGRSCLPESFEENKFFLQFYSTFYHPTVMLRSEIYKQNLYDEKFLYAEDYELWARLVFEKGICSANLDECLLKYRINQQGISKKNAERQACTAARAFERYVVMSAEETAFHKNIFFLHERPVRKNETHLLKTVKLKLLQNEKRLVFPAYIKLLFHLKKFHQWKLFLFAALCPLGVYSLQKYLSGER